MRRIGWTSMIAMLALLFVLMSATMASASPGEVQAHATFRFDVVLGDSVAQPFNRWLTEFADLAALTIDSVSWEHGEAMVLRLSMNENEAWSVSFLADEDGVSMECSMMGEGSVKLREKDAEEARALMVGMKTAALGPETRTMTAAQAAALARGAAQTLARWGRDARDTEGEAAVGMANFLETLAELMEKSPEEACLCIGVEQREETDILPIAHGADEAPLELPGALAVEGLRAVFLAVVE